MADTGLNEMGDRTCRTAVSSVFRRSSTGRAEPIRRWPEIGWVPSCVNMPKKIG